MEDTLIEAKEMGGVRALAARYISQVKSTVAKAPESLGEDGGWTRPGWCTSSVLPAGQHLDRRPVGRMEAPTALTADAPMAVDAPAAQPLASNPPVSVAQALDLQLAAAEEGSHIVQVCCIDHATDSEGNAHLHLQCHFSNHTHSPWFQLNLVSLQELKDVLAALPALPNGRQPRLHLHANDRPKPTEPDFAESVLPRGILADPAALAKDTCPICLAPFEAEDEVVVLPCRGRHTTHWGCLRPWLATASSCPTCRHALPTTKQAAAAAAGTALLEAAQAELRRLERPRVSVAY